MTRTIVLTDRMHAVLMHALDCAGAWCDEEWEADERHVAALTPLVEPLDDLADLRKLRNICKAAKISNPAGGAQADRLVDSASIEGATPSAAAGEGTCTVCGKRLRPGYDVAAAVGNEYCDPVYCPAAFGGKVGA